VYENYGFTYEDHLDIIVDLSKSELELWKEVSSKRRNEIRRASKDGLVFSVETDVKALIECYKILEEVYSRAKLPLFSYVFFENMYKYLINESKFHIFTARFENIIVGCMLALGNNGVLYDFYAGSKSEYYRKHPNDLIPWEVFLWGKRNGYHTFDFGGAGKPGVPYKVRDYKKQFGGTLVNYGRFKLILNKPLYKIGEYGLKLLKSMGDFKFSIINDLIADLKSANYQFTAYSQYIVSPSNRAIIFRHDVDRVPENSLTTAKLESSLGVKGTYYFRVVPESFNLEIMHKISELGHEIGYHYEDVDLVVRNRRKNGLEVRGERLGRNKGLNEITRERLIDPAYESFCKNLGMLRKNFDIKTICMHGSPRAKYDNKIIWEKYNYKDLGIIGEPYFDIDFNEFAYFTDTGRRWNGQKVSIRDKVDSKYKFDFKTTQEIIDNIDQLPNKIMFTIHPERWHDKPLPWMKELVLQNVKNVVKRGLLVVRG